MPRHEQADVSFDVPRHWEDKTLVAYASPPKDGQATAANLVMTRDVLGERETLADYADRQLAELVRRLEGFELVRREETTLGGLPAIALRFGSRAAAGPLLQRLVVAEGRRRSVYCFTATTPKADAAQNDPLLDRILSTVRFPLIPGGNEADEAAQ
ncbi:MAG: DcrB-related protein [Byssovorax sp.]